MRETLLRTARAELDAVTERQACAELDALGQRQARTVTECKARPQRSAREAEVVA